MRVQDCVIMLERFQMILKFEEKIRSAYVLSQSYCKTSMVKNYSHLCFFFFKDWSFPETRPLFLGWNCVEAFQDLQPFVPLWSLYGEKSWIVFLKNLNFFVTEEIKAQTSWMTWVWVNYQDFVLFWKWTNPLRRNLTSNTYRSSCWRVLTVSNALKASLAFSVWGDTTSSSVWKIIRKGLCFTLCRREADGDGFGQLTPLSWTVSSSKFFSVILPS